MKRRALKPAPDQNTAQMEVENPNWSRDHHGRKDNPRFVTVTMSLRESSITTMLVRKLINEAQAEAALRFRIAYEAMGGKGAGAIDYTREPVDGGGMVETVTVRQLEAGQELKAARLQLGVRGYRLISQVCGEGHQISELYRDKRSQLSAMDALRGYLDDLAELWNIKSRTKRCA